MSLKEAHTILADIYQPKGENKMILANQPSVMSIDGMIGCLLASLILGAIVMLIQKAKNKELEWRERRKAQKEKAKQQETSATEQPQEKND